MENPKNIPLFTNVDWKFGLITRNVYRTHKDAFLIDDTLDGWIFAFANLEQMSELTEGKLSITDLDWL